MQDPKQYSRRNLVRGGTLGVAATALGVGAAGTSGARTADNAQGQHGFRSLGDFGVSPDSTPASNRKALQEAIDWASPRGGALLLEPSERPYPVESGVRLRMNTSLVGVHGALARGTSHPSAHHPVGSVFAIDSTNRPFITVETGCQLRGLQFWYPEQTFLDPAKVIEYPVTIQRAMDQPVYGVTLSGLSFYGEFATFDFIAPPFKEPKDLASSELILFEHCYGYPLGGKFIDIDYCYDIPRILHCHVNPANRRAIANRDHTPAIIQSVVERKTFAYAIDHTDNAQLMDLFAFGVYGGIRLGEETYGQLTNFNLDCVTIGIHKSGSQHFNRCWQIAQGSIIANTGPRTAELHPIVLDGKCHTSISNVECFSGRNGVIQQSPTSESQGKKEILSQDFLLADGDQSLSATLVGCRMTRFAAEDPITVRNPHATIATYGCFQSRGGTKPVVPYPDGVVKYQR